MLLTGIFSWNNNVWKWHIDTKRKFVGHFCVVQSVGHRPTHNDYHNIHTLHACARGDNFGNWLASMNIYDLHTPCVEIAETTDVLCKTLLVILHIRAPIRCDSINQQPLRASFIHELYFLSMIQSGPDRQKRQLRWVIYDWHMHRDRVTRIITSCTKTNTTDAQWLVGHISTRSMGQAVCTQYLQYTMCMHCPHCPHSSRADRLPIM